MKYYQQALAVCLDIGNLCSVRGATLTNIGLIYSNLGQYQEALNFYQQSLDIRRQIGDRRGEGLTLNNMGFVYRRLDQYKKALEFYQQALAIRREIGDRGGEASTLNNLGIVYRDTNQPSKAIRNLEASFKITLEMRVGVSRENRKAFLAIHENTVMNLADFLIQQNQPQKAFEWLNLAATTDLADYNRLINAKVTNPHAQKAIDNWNQKKQQLQFIQQQLRDKSSEKQAQRMRTLEREVFKQAEDMANRFPEVAELFETKPTDIDQLRQNIPKDTVVIQPVLLADVGNVSNTIAIFVLAEDQLKVVQNQIEPKEFEQLLTQYRTQLEDYHNSDYIKTSKKLYDILIRPVEAQIQANSPKYLAIITTGQLRYIPFETLRDSKTNQYLIQKYPIQYLTRISSSRQSKTIAPLKLVVAGVIIGGIGIWGIHKFGILPGTILIAILGGITFLLITRANFRTNRALALANPQPTNKNLSGTEEEAKRLIEIFPDSEAYIGTHATLDTFKTQAPRFSLLHLGTHGCFVPEGCPSLGMEANTLLFANRQTYKIADAALLGLKNTELIALSACQTAKQTSMGEQSISGLAYIFERAGAKSVIANLWNAEDKTSQAIMVEFYKNLKNGKSKSKAMQQAKLAQINRHPFFWSSLILIGSAD